MWQSSNCDLMSTFTDRSLSLNKEFLPQVYSYSELILFRFTELVFSAIPMISVHVYIWYGASGLLG